MAGADQKPWLKSYPEGMPAEIGPLSAASIGDFLAEACRQHGERPAFTCMGKSLSFAELERQSSKLGGSPRSRSG